MEYSDLKDIVSVKSFDIIHKLIASPTLELYLRDYKSVDDAVSIASPYDDDVMELSDIVSNGLELIKKVDCIYTFDKTLLVESDTALGSTSTLTVYMRFDDVPPSILNKDNSIVIKFDGREYEAEDIQNAYGIIVQANLKS